MIPFKLKLIILSEKKTFGFRVTFTSVKGFPPESPLLGAGWITSADPEMSLWLFRESDAQRGSLTILVRGYTIYIEVKTLFPVLLAPRSPINTGILSPLSKELPSHSTSVPLHFIRSYLFSSSSPRLFQERDMIYVDHRRNTCTWGSSASCLMTSSAADLQLGLEKITNSPYSQ